MAAPTVAELQDRLEELRVARASGVRSARFGDDEVSYRTDAELKAAIRDLQADIDRLTGATSATTLVVRSTKGW